MIIKKYLAKTETHAIEMAKEDLGSNAVVMKYLVLFSGKRAVQV